MDVPALPAKGLGHRRAAATVRTLSSKVLVSKYHSPLKGLLGEAAHSRAGPGNIQE